MDIARQAQIKLQKSLYSIDLKYKKIIEQWSLAKRKQRDIDKAKRRIELWVIAAKKNEKRKEKGKPPIKKEKRKNYEQMYDKIYALYTVLKWSYIKWEHTLFNKCISCWKEMEVWHIEPYEESDYIFIRNSSCQNWHYISRSKSKALKYYDDNTWSQCANCNWNLSGNLHEYRRNLIQKIWQDSVDLLHTKDLKSTCMFNKYSEQWIPLISEKSKTVHKRLCSVFKKEVHTNILMKIAKDIEIKLISYDSR